MVAMLIRCPNIDCKKEFVRKVESDVRLSWELKFVSCPYCGELIEITTNIYSRENVSSRKRT